MRKFITEWKPVIFVAVYFTGALAFAYWAGFHAFNAWLP